MTTTIDMENLDKFAELVKVAKEQGCYDLVSEAFKSGVKLGSDTEREAIALECGAMSADWLVFMEAVERALREKNT